MKNYLINKKKNMTKFKNWNCDKTKISKFIKLEILICDNPKKSDKKKTQHTQIVTKPKTQYVTRFKQTKNVANLLNLNCGKNSKT